MYTSISIEEAKNFTKKLKKLKTNSKHTKKIQETILLNANCGVL